MRLSQELITLAQYLAGEFDNSVQAMADPAWYVHLRLLHRPVPITLFPEPSITLFAEQANVLNLERPYRPRIIQLKQLSDNPAYLQVQYYLPKDVGAVQGAGRNPEILSQLTTTQVEFLPGCTLEVNYQNVGQKELHFQASLTPGELCGFTYKRKYYQVELGFEVNGQEFLSFDKGIDPKTGKGIWGALLGPYRFVKRCDFSSELNF
ncbi:MAG: chromophore lyase CpcT/CpeT [Microcoleaceae cyanobacterium]